jgi:hypothetical protein
MSPPQYVPQGQANLDAHFQKAGDLQVHTVSITTETTLEDLFSWLEGIFGESNHDLYKFVAEGKIFPTTTPLSRLATSAEGVGELVMPIIKVIVSASDRCRLQFKDVSNGQVFDRPDCPKTQTLGELDLWLLLQVGEVSGSGNSIVVMGNGARQPKEVTCGVLSEMKQPLYVVVEKKAVSKPPELKKQGSLLTIRARPTASQVRARRPVTARFNPMETLGNCCESASENCGQMLFIILGYGAFCLAWWLWAAFLVYPAIEIQYAHWATIWYCCCSFCVCPIMMVPCADGDNKEPAFSFLAIIIFGGIWMTMGSFWGEEADWITDGGQHVFLDPVLNPDSLVEQPFRTSTWDTDTTYVATEFGFFWQYEAATGECYSPILPRNWYDTPEYVDPVSGNYTGPMYYWVMKFDCCSRGSRMDKCGWDLDKSMKPTMLYRSHQLAYTTGVNQNRNRIRKEYPALENEPVIVMSWDADIDPVWREDFLNAVMLWMTLFSPFVTACTTIFVGPILYCCIGLSD